MTKRDIKGPENSSWKGDNATYGAVHKWIGNNWGKANSCENTSCLKESSIFHWSNISGQYNRERSDWQQLCAKCHRKFDAGKPKRANYITSSYKPVENPQRYRASIGQTHCKWGHEFTQENTRWGTREGYRIRVCRQCVRNFNSKKRK